MRRLAWALIRSLASLRRPTHVRGGFVPHPCGPVSFSCLPKRKSPKRRAALAAPPCAPPARKVHSRRPVAPTAPPCADGAMSAIPRAPPAGRFGRRPSPPTGRGKSSALLRAQVRAVTSPRPCPANPGCVFAKTDSRPWWVRPASLRAASAAVRRRRRARGEKQRAPARPSPHREYAHGPCMLVMFPFGHGAGAKGRPAGAARGIAPRLPSVHGCTVGKPP